MISAILGLSPLPVHDYIQAKIEAGQVMSSLKNKLKFFIIFLNNYLFGHRKKLGAELSAPSSLYIH